MAAQRDFKIAVIGKMKSGKSSFIRAYLKHNGDNGDIKPPTDIVECTKYPKKYPLPNHPIILWDIPGYGATTISEKEYFKRYQLDQYDSYIMCSATYSDFELDLHNEIAKLGKRYMYVRTKTDMTKRNWMRSQNATEVEWNKEKNRIEQNLKTYFVDVPVFFIDSKKPDELDFKSLVTALPNMAEFSINCCNKVGKADWPKTKQQSTTNKKDNQCSLM